MPDPYRGQFGQLMELHDKIKDLHPALRCLYPIALVNGEMFDIYDLASDGQSYIYQKSAPLPMPVPKGMRAAFPLDTYGGKMACVVTPDVFESPEGFVTILHEFVHCYQFETCEQELKMSLDVARKAKEEGNFMWEIEHPFPYEALEFIRSYQHFLVAVDNKDHQAVIQTRQNLRIYLGRHDFEYMVWQEWKEGFARWIENRVKNQLNYPENRKGLNTPYSRVLFYPGGEALVNYLLSINEKVINELPRLFRRMISL